MNTCRFGAGFLYFDDVVNNYNKYVVTQLFRDRTSDSRLTVPGFESSAACKTFGKSFHSALLQFTQLYE